MKTALISDVHGNLQALEAVLENLEREKVDQIICLGDIALKGPQPHEVVELLRGLNSTYIMGNTDALILNVTPAQVSRLSGEARIIGELSLWAGERLTAEDKEFMKSFKSRVEVTVGRNQQMLCFHGSPESAETRIQPDRSDDDLASLFSGYSAQILAGGHTHLQFLRPFRDSVFINPGSIGFSRGNPPERKAEYAVLDFFEDGYYVKFKKIACDWDTTLEIAKEVGLPHLDWVLSS